VEALHGAYRSSLLADVDGSFDEKLAAIREEFRTDLSNLAAELRRELSAEAGHRGMLGQTLEMQNNSIVQLDSLLTNMVSMLREEMTTVRQEVYELRSCFNDQQNDTTERDIHKARWVDMTSRLESQQNLLAQLNAQVYGIAPKLREEHKTKLDGLSRELSQKHESHSKALEDLAQNAVKAAASAALDRRWRMLQEQLSRFTQMAKLQQDMHSQHLISLENLHLKQAILSKSVFKEDDGARLPILPQQQLLKTCADVMRAMEQSGVQVTPRLTEQDSAAVSTIQAKEGLPRTVLDELQVMRRAIDTVREELSPGGCWQELRDRHLDLSQQVATLQDMHSHYTQKLYMDLRAVIQELGFKGEMQEVPVATARAMAFFEGFDTPRREQLGGLSDEVLRLRQEFDDLRDGISQSPGSTWLAEIAANARGLSTEKELSSVQQNTELVKGAKMLSDQRSGLPGVTGQISPDSAPAVSSAESFRPRQLFDDGVWESTDEVISGTRGTLPEDANVRRGVAPQREGGLWNMVDDQPKKPAQPAKAALLRGLRSGEVATIISKAETEALQKEAEAKVVKVAPSTREVRSVLSAAYLSSAQLLEARQKKQQVGGLSRKPAGAALLRGLRSGEVAGIIDKAEAQAEAQRKADSQPKTKPAKVLVPCCEV